MSNALTALKADYTRRRKVVRLKIALSGNYTNGTGEVLDFTNVANPQFHQNPGLNSLPADLGDFIVDRVPAGYSANIQPNPGGTTLANSYALRINSAAGVELATGAYPAALTGDFLTLEINVSTWGN